jgi:surface antigen
MLSGQKKLLRLGVAAFTCAISFVSSYSNASAKSVHHHLNTRKAAIHHSSHQFHAVHYKSHHQHYGNVIQCVTFVQAASQVHLRGNARDWWYNARGVYARGGTPEVGSVMNFRPIRRMYYGHVALVKRVIDERTVVVDQSHWAQNGISRNTRVIDVSPNNDWSSVRVATDQGGDRFGSIYPLYGFIYPRSDDRSQVMMASAEQDTGLAQVAQAPETVGTIEQNYRLPTAKHHKHHHSQKK